METLEEQDFQTLMEGVGRAECAEIEDRAEGNMPEAHEYARGI